MDSTPQKRHKPPDIHRQTPPAAAIFEEDRISNLPDSILSHILSKLPTKTAIAATVLSTKWKHLFVSIPNLSLLIDEAASNTPRPSPNFVNFMYHLLAVTLRDVTRIDEFALHCNHDYGNSHVDAWVSAALGLKVSSLTLVFHAENTGVSVESIFQCETLEELICRQKMYVEVPDKVFLPNLSKLYLAFVEFRDSESFDILLSGCPVLERLSLDGCVFEEADFLFIHSPSLKFLMLNNCNYDEYYQVDIDTPLLEGLRYNDNIIATYCGRMEFNSLRIASIDVGHSDDMVQNADDDEEVSEYVQNVAKLVAACRNVGDLFLSMDTMTALHLSSCAMPTFENLTELQLGYLNNHGWEFLPHMLNSAPKLDTLVLTGFMENEGCFTKFESSILNCVPTCLCLHLHTIDFKGFSGEQDELELVSYFLTNAEVLRDVEFSFCSSLPIEKQYNTWSKLKLVQRGSKSKNCEIHFANEISMLESFIDWMKSLLKEEDK